MKVNRNLSLSVTVHPFLAIAFLNFLFLAFLLLVFFSFLAVPSGFEIRMPVAGLGGLEEAHMSIRITGENVLYFNGHVVTINDLKRELASQKDLGLVNPVIYLSVDRRASMGRVTDVWGLCKGFGLAWVKIVPS